ncbi:MAG: hypothetical protein J0L50_14280 [Sphingomonadales bacterium]|nr:hypothetical protein [Sphingomonadales bacterium]
MPTGSTSLDTALRSTARQRALPIVAESMPKILSMRFQRLLQSILISNAQRPAERRLMSVLRIDICYQVSLQSEMQQMYCLSQQVMDSGFLKDLVMNPQLLSFSAILRISLAPAKH